MEMINFNNYTQRRKTYSGANGNKLCINIDNELYMLKLNPSATKNDKLSYTNSCVSEYLGSNIFNMLGLKAQETLLGTYTYENKTRIAVACKDFEVQGYILKDFASAKNQIIDSTSNGYGTELKDILETIEKQNLIDVVELSNLFWDMFVIDALIGNWDRHNGNWGFLYNQETDDVKIAPIYDCGSCLFPQVDEEMINKILKEKSLFNARVYDFPTSALLYNGKRINYFIFIKSHEYKECDEAIDRIKKRINLIQLLELIDSIPCISDNHKLFLKKILEKRIEIFLNA